MLLLCQSRSQCYLYVPLAKKKDFGFDLHLNLRVPFKGLLLVLSLLSNQISILLLRRLHCSMHAVVSEFGDSHFDCLGSLVLANSLTITAHTDRKLRELLKPRLKRLLHFQRQSAAELTTPLADCCYAGPSLTIALIFSFALEISHLCFTLLRWVLIANFVAKVASSTILITAES